AVFDNQKLFLKEKTPFDFVKFTELFNQFKDYSPAQAAEILPLFLDYKTNVAVAMPYRFWVDTLEKNINKRLNPPTSTPTQSAPPSPPPQAIASTPSTAQHGPPEASPRR